VRQAADAAAPTPDEELSVAFAGRQIEVVEIERALEVLSRPDPAGVSNAVITFDEVASVAAYLRGRIGRVWYPTPEWMLIESGHPAARALFVHERAELQAYRKLRIRQPLRVRRPGRTYDRAHAWACWQEAQYWEAWAGRRGHVPKGARPPLRRSCVAIRSAGSLTSKVWSRSSYGPGEWK
jgi:hypothetical protein